MARFQGDVDDDDDDSHLLPRGRVRTRQSGLPGDVTGGHGESQVR